MIEQPPGAVGGQDSAAATRRAWEDASQKHVHEFDELLEHPEPFWKPAGVDARAWDGRLPNTLTLLARRAAVTA